MTRKHKQQLALALLGVLFAALAWRQWGPSLGAGDRVAGRAAVTTTRDSDSARGSGELPEVDELRLEDLEAVSGELRTSRNPFEVEAPPSPARPTAADLREALRERVERQAVPAARPEPARPTPPPVDVVFLGSFGPDTGRLAVFTDGREIYNVAQGQVLKEKFVVVRIGFESADLGFVDFPTAPTRRLEIGG